MREYQFRGKRLDTGDWVYGSLIHTNRYTQFACRIQPYIHKEYAPPVDPETMGQYTGLYDKNGKEIYEGDRVNVKTIQYQFNN